MINQQNQQIIFEAIKLTNDNRANIRIEGISRLANIGIPHPQIINILNKLAKEDPDNDVRIAAVNSLKTLNNYIFNSRMEQNEIEASLLEKESNIVQLLEKQNSIITSLYNLLLNSMESENISSYRIKSRIVDINMSIGEMISFQIKWILAAIPIGIILGVIYVIILLISPGR